jgi:uncharacterized protein YbbC (DUF1343 family)
MVQTGLDRLAQGDGDVVKRLQGRRVGLLAHAASVDGELRHVLGVMRDAGITPRALFGPEHGLSGAAQDMIAVDGEQSGTTAVHSLYGDHEEDLSPRPEWLDDLDVVVIDLQDIGSRYYTFVWTAVLMLRACAARGVETVVFDRPNPLGGVAVEGMPQRPGYRSFVGLRDVAVRHGMTIGEVCTQASAEEQLDGLHVVRMHGWERAMSFEATGLPWVLPSPNMPTLDTVRVYPGGCLLEGTTLSEGRGTTRPFEIWGAPGLDGEALARACTIEGARLRPLGFTPTFQKHGGRSCGGVQIHVTEPQTFRPYAAYLKLIAAVRRVCAEVLAWRTEPYEFVHDRPAIDLLTGGPEYRTLVDDGASIDDYLDQDASGAGAFAARRAPHLLY